MLGACDHKRIKTVAGLWTKEQLVGSKVRIVSMPVSNFTTGSSLMNSKDGTKAWKTTIKSIDFSTSIDGKVVTVIRLDGWDGYFFTWKDLEILSICDGPIAKNKVGTFLCGEKVL